MPVRKRIIGVCRHIWSRWTRWRRVRTARRAMSRFTPPYRLNVGCGQVALEGWVNVDVSSDSRVVNLVWDARDRFPIDDGTCRFIYNEHFLEHLTIEDGVAFLRECRRILQPDGVLRIAMPSLEEVVRQYYENDWKDQPSLQRWNLTWIQTRAELLNVAFRWWGHQWLYDREELHRRLREAGFTVMRDVEIGMSTFPELRNRESRLESTLICEASA